MNFLCTSLFLIHVFLRIFWTKLLHKIDSTYVGLPTLYNSQFQPSSRTNLIHTMYVKLQLQQPTQMYPITYYGETYLMDVHTSTNI
jgi:hypothetical protein